jgi:hypothetical protein
MCTVSVVPTDDSGVRVMVNRDERRDRPAARPPALHRTGERLAIYPVDTGAGGTWAGANDAGLVAVLLNRSTSERSGAPSGGRSGGPSGSPRALTRGLVVPHVLRASTLEDATAAGLSIDATRFAPFRLVLQQRRRCVVLVSDGRTLSASPCGLDRPLVFTSSSLGDHIVQGCRTRLFDEMVRPGRRDLLVAQRAFHAHRWADHPEISVWMARPDAATVSRMTLDVRDSLIAVRYAKLDEHGT